MVQRLLIPFLLCGGLLACSGDAAGDGAGGTPDGGSPNDGTGDTGAGPDAGGDPEPEVPTYSGTCTSDDVAPAFETGGIRDGSYYYYASETPETPFMVWYITAATDVAPGTYDLADQTPETCTVCVYALDACDAAQQQCAQRIDATEGYVVLDEVGPGRLRGTLHNVKFGDADPGLCGDGHTFDVLIGPEEPATIGDNVMDFSLTNCGTGEQMSIGQLAARTRGFWIVGTAGWCPACRQWLPQVLSIINEADPSLLDVAFVVGEDDVYGEPDVAFCQRYADRYGAPHDYFFIDHNGTFSFATLFQFMSPHAGPNGEFGLPWNAVIRGDLDNEYVYSDGTDGDLQATIEEILAP